MIGWVVDRWMDRWWVDGWINRYKNEFQLTKTVLVRITKKDVTQHSRVVMPAEVTSWRSQQALRERENWICWVEMKSSEGIMEAFWNLWSGSEIKRVKDLETLSRRAQEKHGLMLPRQHSLLLARHHKAHYSHWINRKIRIHRIVIRLYLRGSSAFGDS